MARERLHGSLSTVEYFTFGFGTMIGVGWLVLMDDWLTRGGPAGGILGFLLGGLLLFPIAHTYGRLVQRIQDAGAEIAYTEGVMPASVSFAAGWTMVLSYAIVCPWEAVATGNLLARVFPSLNSYQLYVIDGSPIFAPRLAVGLALTALVAGVNYRGIKPSGIFQDVMTFGLLIDVRDLHAARLRPGHAVEHAAAVCAGPVALAVGVPGAADRPVFHDRVRVGGQGIRGGQGRLRSAQLHEGDLRRAGRRLSLLRPDHRGRHLRVSVAGDRVGPRAHRGRLRTDVRLASDRAADPVRRVPVAVENLQRQLRRRDPHAVRDRPAQPGAPVARPRASTFRHAGRGDRR